MTEKIFEDLNDRFEQEAMPPGKRKVLKAAVELFSKKGFDGTSTSEIAKLSGMSEGTIFKHFKTKKDLLNFIIQSAVENLIPNYANDFIESQLPKDESVDNFIRFIVKNRLEFLYVNKGIILILINEIMVNDELLIEVKERLTPKFNKLQKTLELVFINLGITFKSEAFIRLVAGQIMLEFIMITRLAPSGNYDLETATDNITRIILKTLQ